MPGHLFLSYVRERTPDVLRLAQALESYGLETWLDRKSLTPGARWKDAIRTAIRGGDLFIACFSRELIEKDRSFMNEEITLAVDELRLRPTDRSWFIPVVLDGCDVPPRAINATETLRDLQWVDLSVDWEAGVESIARVALARRALPDKVTHVAEAEVISRKTVFLSYPASARHLVALLKPGLLENFVIIEYQPAADEAVSTTVDQYIARADYFLAIWYPKSALDDQISPWLPYELGVANALHRPSLLMVARLVTMSAWQRIDRDVPTGLFSEHTFAEETIPEVIEYCRTNWMGSDK